MSAPAESLSSSFDWPAHLRALGERRQVRADTHRDAERTELRIGNLGVAILAGTVLTLILVATDAVSVDPTRALTVGLVLLAATIAWRARWSRRRRRLGYAIEWLERSAQRREDVFDFDQDDGREYVDRTHAYSYDLDLFGPRSLFHRLNACHTPIGRDALAAWIEGNQPGLDPQARQAAVRELLGDLDTRESLEVALRELTERGARYPADVLAARTRALVAWGATPPPPPPSGLDRAARWLLPGLALAGLVAMLVFGRHWLWAGIPYGVNLWYIQRQRDLGDLTRRFEGVRSTLGAWADVLELLSGLGFESTLLSTLIEPLARPGSEAPAALRRLRRLADRLSQRRNAFWALTGNALLLWDVRARDALMEWKRQHGAELADWFAGAGGLEAMAALCAYTEGNPSAVWPVLRDDGPMFEGTGLEHPLLPRATRVGNDCALESPGALWIVTGSNMSGKSTFIRSVGLTALLSQLGLPVSATSARMRPLRIVTSMKVEESLAEGLSRFHAEVRRLRSCMDEAAREGPSLVLLDEILAGTNSRERRLGTVGVLQRLGGLPTATLVSTHDLGLADIAVDPGREVRVVHFTDEVKDGRMTFDYKLRDGALPSTNALEVMRLEGIEIDDDGEGSGGLAGGRL